MIGVHGSLRIDVEKHWDQSRSVTIRTYTTHFYLFYSVY